MLSGVEIAGLVLGIVPLMITALEHHKAELAPFQALFEYTKKAQKACQDLGSVDAYLWTALTLIATDCGLTAAQSKAVFKLPNWDGEQEDGTESEAKEKLVEHFGSDAYGARLDRLLQRIFAQLKSIATDLPINVNLDSDNVEKLWKEIVIARSELNSSSSKRMKSTKAVADEFLHRAKLVFKAGTLQSRLDSLEADVHKLHEMRDIANKLGTKTSRKLRFIHDLAEIQRHAMTLFETLRSVDVCKDQKEHRFSLKLEERLGKSTLTKTGHVADAKLSFTVALSQPCSGAKWKSFEVEAACEGESKGSSQPDRPQARFKDCHSQLSWKELNHNLCNSLASSQKVVFGVGAGPKLKMRSTDAVTSIATMNAVDSLSIKSLLGKTIPGSTTESIITFPVALKLGLTITASFLQLYPSPWLRGRWSTNDIVLLRERSSRALDPIYVHLGDIRNAKDAQGRVGQPSSIPTTLTASDSGMNDGPKLLALASIILELGLDQKIEELRSARDSLGLYFTVRRCLADARLKETSSCFLEAARFCFERSGEAANLKQDISPQELADSVVYPFLRDLAHSRASL